MRSLQPMPVLAHLDDPPRSRARDLVVGLVVAVPVAVALMVWFIPFLVAAVLGGAEGLDTKLREQEAYMQRVCGEAYREDRDAELCACVVGVEFPGLDCQDPLRRWGLAQQVRQCDDAVVRKSSLSYCSCIDVVAEAVAEASDPDAARQQAQAFDRCEAVPDAVPHPTLEALANESG